MSPRILLLALTIVAIAGKAIAAPFSNLNFELAKVQSAPTPYTPKDAYPPISAAAALPGWTVTEDMTLCNAVSSSPALDETSVCLIGSSIPNNYPAISGKFSVELYSYTDAPGYYQTSSISQTGDIADCARLIVFSVRAVPGGAIILKPSVLINGTPIVISKASTNGGVQTWSGDVSAFAGLTAQLTFSAAGIPGSSPSNEVAYDLDDISFQVPEPAVTVVLVPAVLILLRRRSRFVPSNCPRECM